MLRRQPVTAASLVACPTWMCRRSQPSLVVSLKIGMSCTSSGWTAMRTDWQPCTRSLQDTNEHSFVGELRVSTSKTCHLWKFDRPSQKPKHSGCSSRRPSLWQPLVLSLLLQLALSSRQSKWRWSSQAMSIWQPVSSRRQTASSSVGLSTWSWIRSQPRLSARASILSPRSHAFSRQHQRARQSGHGLWSHWRKLFLYLLLCELCQFVYIVCSVRKWLYDCHDMFEIEMLVANWGWLDWMKKRRCCHPCCVDSFCVYVISRCRICQELRFDQFVLKFDWHGTCVGLWCISHVICLFSCHCLNAVLILSLFVDACFSIVRHILRHECGAVSLLLHFFLYAWELRESFVGESGIEGWGTELSVAEWLFEGLAFFGDQPDD